MNALALCLMLAWPSTAIESGKTVTTRLEGLKGGESYRIQVALDGPIGPDDRATVRLSGAGIDGLGKTIHAGDPDLYLGFRPTSDGDGSLKIEAGTTPIRIKSTWAHQPIPAADRAAFEVEPNDTWQSANPLDLGRSVYGTADDVDYLENLDEGKAGIDWFRFHVIGDSPILAYFQLELLDRDVSANLRVHRLDRDKVVPHEAGKDPMEVVHDRERERYSTHLSRTLTPGTYFVEVIANHPAYILRSRAYPVPPGKDPALAVEAGLDYILEVGDAWFAQVPREGNAFVRSANLHDTATRCTACHASSFPTEAALVGQANGYPIRAKASMQYLMDRLANSPTPLYGEDGLMWQRFIAIPLQSQGKQGGIVLDFQRQVEGKDSAEFERFGPFLKAAWRGRRDLPADELNGVVPLDSKFGLAWRDWRVLTEMTRRTGQVAYAQAADAIADILDDPETDRQVETRQDRIHRLYAWWLIDKEHFAPRIKLESEALLARQNPDGGWHEQDGKPGPSAVYTTGQVAWTLLKLGHKRDEPAIARSLDYLMGQQQPFGGWFQTTTHENFRTPMRETRYAVEALAEAFPRPGGPLKSWGNRDGEVAHLPRTGRMLETLDDLDDLWDVPEADRSTYARAIHPLLDDPEPLIRARAAACLGRMGDSSSVDPLISKLNDPSKIVWRAAAWSLRRLGNRGIGVDAIARALDSPDPSVRRGATRVFAYQYHGMDTRVDLADRLIARTSDPDLWVRLQALRSLRQWFYRTADDGLKRRIVDTYLARMAVAEAPVVRKALIEGMYILLDENLGGGVSLQKNLAILPEKYRRNAMKAREAVERDVLLGPILAALESGNPIQREAIVKSFDGSFFKGRGHARRPTGMIDVGNDREFGFLYEPPADLLDRTFAALLASDASPEVRRRSIQLASFFLVPERSKDPTIASMLLRSTTHADDGVRLAARSVVANDLRLNGADVSFVLAALRGQEPERRAIVRAIARSPDILENAEVMAELRRRLAQESDIAPMVPVLHHPSFTDAEVLAAVPKAWPVTTDPADRLALLETLLSRPALVDLAEPRPEVLDVLRLAVNDPSATIRERTLGAVGGMSRFRSGRSSISLLLSSLADDSPSLRRVGLDLASKRADFWGRPDARERLLALLVDPDGKVRERALGVVEGQGLIRGEPGVARRVKALSGDLMLKSRSERAMTDQGFDPSKVEADVAIGRPRLLSLSTFRTKVNPLFKLASDDGVSCVKCHANHNVLRVVEAEPGRLTEGEALMINYNSVLKVVNLGDPESSLVLRKPRSPQGQGGPDPASPTGLTHNGGPRWETTDHPSYRAILSWIREASAEAGSKGPAIAPSTDSYSPGYAPALAVDGDLATIWHTEFQGASPGYPHEIVVDLGSSRKVDGFLYVPRQDGSNGRVKAFEVDVSSDGKSWATASRGSWPDDPSFKFVALAGQVGRFVKLRGLSEVNGLPFMSAAEVSVDSSGVEVRP